MSNSLGKSATNNCGVDIKTDEYDGGEAAENETVHQLSVDRWRFQLKIPKRKSRSPRQQDHDRDQTFQAQTDQNPNLND